MTAPLSFLRNRFTQLGLALLTMVLVAAAPVVTSALSGRDQGHAGNDGDPCEQSLQVPGQAKGLHRL